MREPRAYILEKMLYNHYIKYDTNMAYLPTVKPLI